MNQGPLVFLGVFAALVASWYGMIVQPQFQVGRATPGTNVVDASALYPVARSGLAQQGLEVYRSLGCATCHTRQVRQDGILLDVILTEPGTNTPAVVEAMARLRKNLPLPEAGRLLEKLPVRVLTDLEDPVRASAAAKSLTEAGAKARVELVPQGPDIEVRHWGRGRTVAADFLYDAPALPGTIRLGPDLSNVGSRLPSPEWHYLHLYEPELTSTNSVMPPYRFLFERRKVGDEPSAGALVLPPWGVELVGEGYEVVPKDEAKALVAFLMSLRSEVPLIERPVAGAPGASTNAVPAAIDGGSGGGTSTTNASS